MQCAQVTFSSQGLSEGYLFNQLPQAVREEDPLLTAGAEIAERESRFSGLGESLMTWCDPPFDDDNAEERRLRLAACHLRSAAHTSELQALMRHSSAVFCLKKKTNDPTTIIVEHATTTCHPHQHQARQTYN